MRITRVRESGGALAPDEGSARICLRTSVTQWLLVLPSCRWPVPQSCKNSVM